MRLTIFEGGTPAAARLGCSRKRRGEDDREGAAHQWRRRRRGCRARSIQRARRSAKPATPLRRRLARPKRRSIFRSSCATTSRGLKYQANDLPARCNCSTSDGGGARSASSRGSTNETAQPLLASTFYLTRALAPFADVRLGDRGAPQQAITQFLDQKLPMIVLADVGTLSPEIRERLAAWIEQGGVLVRFAGPRLAQADDDLVPVKLRRGGRILGGSLTWEKPQHLASFAADGPFAGLAVPKDITVNRQVLAEPDAVLATKSWASLEDGTPLVTGEHRGKGVVSLFHVSADMRWSDLPMSGSFVEMLRRIVDMSGYTSSPGAGVASESEGRHGGAAAYAGRFRRVRTAALDRKANAGGFPRPRDIRSSARILRPGRRSSRGQCAGGRGSHRAARYFGLARAACQLHQCRTARSARHPAVVVAGIVPDRRHRGRHARRRHRRVAETARRRRLHWRSCSSCPRCWPRHQPSRADDNDDFAIKSVSQTRLAYVVTGNADVDSIVKAGMSGLTLFLAQRTALEAGDPVGVDPAHDELAFFPLIYWPVVPGAAEAAAGRHQPHRRLHETGRHRGVRYPRCHRGAARESRRIADAGHAGVAQYSLLA